MRDEYRQSRGCGFVKYSSKETAMAAIDGLNGTYTMRGCNQPLIVRFADPKRPKPGESRDMTAPVGLGSGPRFQVSGQRPTSNFGDSSGDVSHTNPWRPANSQNVGPPSNTGIRGAGTDFSPRPGQATLPSNQGGLFGGYGVPPLNPLPVSGVSSSAKLQQQNRAAGQQISPLKKPLHSPQGLPLRPHFPGAQAPLQNPYTYSSQLPSSQLPPQQNVTRATAPQTPLNINLRPTHVSSATDQFPPRSQQQPLQKMQHPPSELAQLLSQQTQSLQATLQSSQQAISQLQQQVQSMQQPNQNLPLSQNGQAGKQQWAGSAIPTVVSTTGSTPVSFVQTAAPAVSQSVVSVKCTWTEHTSPDGFKYYYNGLTGESKWEKPEEMIVFEREQQQQQQHQEKPTIQQPQTQLQPLQQQPQQVHQQYQGQQLQHPFHSSLYPTPGSNHNAQYPSLPVGQNSQFPMPGISQNAQDYARTHIPVVGAASMNDLSRTQQSRQSPQELMWKNKA
uniref:Flowering time control protein FCA n=1 Tax=Arabidopsis lyrata subsp. petraea TaxID=59691 RepID=A0A0N6WMD3_ARALP|nr:flowering time control protein FCA [Arabidopsis lyrata subsp. petraea]